MLIAILYTGELRTCFKTIEYTKKNILLNDDIHVFATIQNADTIECNEFIKTHIGSNLKNLTHFNKTEIVWNFIQDELLSKMSINNSTYNYLKQSGSMIENYQSYLSYKSLLEYEKAQNIKYDYIVRLRTDIIYTQQLNFNFTKLTISDIKENLQLINNITKERNLLSLKNVKLFFNNLLFEKNKILRNSANYLNIDIHSNSDNFNIILNCIINENKNKNENNENNILENIHRFLNDGKYIITIRKNLFFLIKRDFFSEIVNLGITYGIYKNNIDEYWWNSESQLQEICKQNNITIFDSATLIEDNSLYKYNYHNYFNQNNKLYEELECLLFICRN